MFGGDFSLRSPELADPWDIAYISDKGWSNSIGFRHVILYAQSISWLGEGLSNRAALHHPGLRRIN